MQTEQINLPSYHQPSLRIGKYEIIDHLNTLANIIGRSKMSKEDKHLFHDELKRTKALVNNL